MSQPNLTMAEAVGRAARIFEEQRTGLVPKSVAVVQSDGALVITLHGALSQAEMVLARTTAGAARLQEYHRQLFASASQALRDEIKRITGVEVHEAAAEIEPSTGAVVAVFTTGTVVQVYLLAHSIPAEVWNAAAPVPPEGLREERET
jgi:uncharacterized protein YbcI